MVVLDMPLSFYITVSNKEIKMGYFSMLACMLVLLVMNDISKIKKKLNKIEEMLEGKKGD